MARPEPSLPPNADAARAPGHPPGWTGGPRNEVGYSECKNSKKMSFRTHHRISRQKANYMDNLSVKVLVPSFLRMETSSFIRSDEQISRFFFSKTRDDFSESSFGTHCCPRTEFKKWATGVLVLISGRSCPSAIRNTRALLLTPPELGERALQRR